MGLIRTLDDIHPDSIRRQGFVVSPGIRYQLTREWCYLVGARVARKAGSEEVTLRFFTSPLFLESASDKTRGLLVVDEEGSGARADEELLLAGFENGICLEVHATGSTATESFILALAWVERDEFVKAFPKPECHIRDAWEKAACRGGTPLHSDYPLGEVQDAQDAVAGGLWEGDGIPYIEDEGGDPILDSAGAALYSSSGT